MEFSLDFFAALQRMQERRAALRLEPAPVATPAPSPLPDGLDCPARIGTAGLTLIKRFEGCERRRKDGLFEAYPDPGTGGDPWTIGWGATGTGIARGTIWTQEQCDARLETDLIRFAREVARAIGDAPTSQAQFDALASFHYNTGAIFKATLTRLHRAGKHDLAADEFGKWVHAGGKRLGGLVRRRKAEALLYRSG